WTGPRSRSVALKRSKARQRLDGAHHRHRRRSRLPGGAGCPGPGHRPHVARHPRVPGRLHRPGPDSRGALEQVIALAERCTTVPLLGNHEEMVLAALEGQSELRYWLRFGGTEALASYAYRGGPELRPADLRALIPSEHLQFIKDCRDYFETVRH